MSAWYYLKILCLAEHKFSILYHWSISLLLFWYLIVLIITVLTWVNIKNTSSNIKITPSIFRPWSRLSNTRGQKGWQEIHASSTASVTRTNYRNLTSQECVTCSTLYTTRLLFIKQRRCHLWQRASFSLWSIEWRVGKIIGS